MKLIEKIHTSLIYKDMFHVKYVIYCKWHVLISPMMYLYVIDNNQSWLMFFAD